jgi:hypothetical protein
MTKYEQLILDRVIELIHKKKIGNDFLVANLQLSVDYLNLTRVSDYAKEIKTSNWGTRKQHKDKIVKVCGHQLIVNNE